jgi:hypothetical protein
MGDREMAIKSLLVSDTHPEFCTLELTLRLYIVDI